MTNHAALDALVELWGSTGSSSGALVDLVQEELIRAGLDRSTIHRNETVVLPGTYDPGPQSWDLVVVEDGAPVAAVEFKSARGPTFGNNFNNRVAEILARAVNLGRPYEPDLLGAFKPCMALCFTIEDCESSTTPIRTRPNRLAADFDTPGATSYMNRYGNFFERLLRDGRYDAVCYMALNRSDVVSVSEPHSAMSFDRFAQSIVNRIMEGREERKRSTINAVELGRRLAGRDDLGKVVLGISSTPEGLSAMEAAVIEHRRQLVSQLRQLALAKDINETKMQHALAGNYWLFGGQYVSIATRRNLVPLDQHDIPLICADRSLHIVELKGPASRIVRKHRNHLIVADEVHEAVSQCMNYLNSLDDMGATLQTVHRSELGLDYEYSRARGTVIIGHKDRASAHGFTRVQVDQAIRSYNAHHSRVQVLTYDDLLDSAERALKFDTTGSAIS